MSKSARYEWHDQQAALNQLFKQFLKHPGDAEMAALLADMRMYAQAARQGSIEIPVVSTVYG
ncbi:MAG: hypothetical protein JWP59_2405 [Massilia sp.]|nr:hypothetical protein [Massilia sp.]